MNRFLLFRVSSQGQSAAYAVLAYCVNNMQPIARGKVWIYARAKKNNARLTLEIPQIDDYGDCAAMGWCTNSQVDLVAAKVIAS